MSSQSPTSSGIPRLSEIARHVIAPSGIVSTGWPAVRDKCRELGVLFDPWQHGTGRLILAKRTDGRYATTVGGVVISIPRQVGKTYLLGAIVFALSLLFPGLTVIWTAHRLRTAAETFQSMQAMARRKKIAPHVAKVILGSGDEEIRFRNGSRILFGARERGFGRGFSMVDVLVFDEAQILAENAIDDMVPATNQAANPLILFTGTPPKPTDPGEVFRRKRSEALAGESDDTVYVEFSADRDAKLDDWAQVAKANPSYPKRTPREAVLRMRKNLTEESYVREALGIWDELGAELIPIAAWNARAVVLADRPTGAPVFFLDCSPGLASWSINAAAMNDGTPHLELADYRRGYDGLVARAVELAGRYPEARFAHLATGAVSALLPQLETAGVKSESFTNQDMGRACAHLQKLVADGGLTHSGDPLYVQALAAAVSRDIGDDLWTWSRRKSGDISPLVSATGAAWLLELSQATTTPMIFF
jgi:phage terminase large subunit-like protein